jgi:hypothetical protein
MVDADPQCNLTGVVLGLNPEWPEDEDAPASSGSIKGGVFCELRSIFGPNTIDAFSPCAFSSAKHAHCKTGRLADAEQRSLYYVRARAPYPCPHICKF